jgi:FkbM family methyltransferase
MRILQKGAVTFQPLKIFKIIINKLNHDFALSHVNNFPQLVIFSFDHIGLSINLEGRYENESLSLVENYIKDHLLDSKDSVAMDIGANIGNHSLALSKYFRKVYSFEPNPITYDVLTINSKYAAAKKNIVPFNFGLSDEDGELPFLINTTNIGGSCILPNDHNNDEQQQRIIVQVKTADSVDFLREEKISLIKIDVEGHEINALRGAESIIKSNKPTILFEQGIDEIKEGGSEVIDYLSSLDYSFYTIEKRFYFGESFIFKLVGLAFRSIFGYQLSFVKTDVFKKRFYEMILAIPKY